MRRLCCCSVIVILAWLLTVAPETVHGQPARKKNAWAFQPPVRPAVPPPQSPPLQGGGIEGGVGAQSH